MLGESGSGKTYSVKTLDPKETYYINCDKKSPTFTGWKALYNADNKNFAKESDAGVIMNLLTGIAEKRPEVKNVVIDTLSSIMSDKEMADRKVKGHDKWVDYAGEIYDLFRLIGELRDDLIVFCLAHTEYYQSAEGVWKTRMKTGGAKLTKLNIEGLSSYTLYTKVDRGEDYSCTYSLETMNSGNNTGRSPEGCFKPIIPNDFGFISKTIREYEHSR